MPATLSPLHSMVARATSLYSLPAVAAEVIRLTDCQKVDTHALKQCIERDPALAAKLLRVVNSSMFGLSGRVEDLARAISLLGTKPLKLLVLGFSLPDSLLADIDSQQLQRYWRGALTRAVAARQLAQNKWNAAGDDAFLVALLQDIGILVLLQQLKTPYARFLSEVRSERQRLVDLERLALDFDHRQLTVALLREWQLPAIYTDAILNEPKKGSAVGSSDSASVLAQVLQLANLLVELVDAHRLKVLPELLEKGECYAGLTKDDVSQLVAELEPQVEQLADVLRLGLEPTPGYDRVLAEAHRQMSLLAEQTVESCIERDERIRDEVLHESQELGRALHEFAHHDDPQPAATGTVSARMDGPRPAGTPNRGPTAVPAVNVVGAQGRLATCAATAAAECRQLRQPLSLVRVELDTPEHHRREIKFDGNSAVEASLAQLMSEYQIEDERVVRMGDGGYAIVLPRTERHTAIDISHRLATLLASGGRTSSPSAFGWQLKAGAASIVVIPKSFEIERLVDAAEACLSAARASGGTAVKSIEVY